MRNLFPSSDVYINKLTKLNIQCLYYRDFIVTRYCAPVLFSRPSAPTATSYSKSVKSPTNCIVSSCVRRDITATIWTRVSVFSIRYKMLRDGDTVLGTVDVCVVDGAQRSATLTQWCHGYTGQFLSASLCHCRFARPSHPLVSLLQVLGEGAQNFA